MPSCSIVMCGSHKDQNQPELTLHRFPMDYELRSKWLRVIGEENINPNHKVPHVCSLHFEKSSFNTTLNVVRLCDNAVPSIFFGVDSNGPLDNENEVYSESNTDDSLYKVSQNSKKRLHTESFKTADLCYRKKFNDEPTEEEYEAIGMNVATKLQRTKVDQRCHAELLINKVLLLGLKNKLNDDTDLIGIGLSQLVEND